MKNTAVSALVFVSVLAIGGCHRPKEYEATVEITRKDVVRKDEAGNAIASDLEISYVECPGTQIEVIRGGKEFSDCIKSLKFGDKAKVKVTHAWDPEGKWDYDVHQVNDCKRPSDPNDEPSFKTVRDCSDWTVNGSADHRYRGNLNIRHDGLDAARLISDLRDIAFSLGSACASGSGRPSHVLRAVGLSDREARSSIRLGFGRHTSKDELIDAVRRIDTAARGQQGLAA